MRLAGHRRRDEEQQRALAKLAPETSPARCRHETYRSPATPLCSASRPVLPRTLLAFDAKAGMAGVGMAGGYGMNGANVMQGVMARVHSGHAGASLSSDAAAAVPAAPIPDATIPDGAAPATLSTPPAVTVSMPRFAGRKMKL